MEEGSHPRGMDAQYPNGAQADTVQTEQRRSSTLSFTGDGTEYFRIWIVNLTLTLLTLGIYSAWAKVRTNRYFYGNTMLDGDSFEYLAEPLQILKGRIIAIAALVIYVLAQTFFPIVSFVLVGLFLVALPVIAVRSLRFNALMSSWRGVRFGFDGAAWDAAKVYLFWPLFGILTLGFGMPYVWYKQNQFTVGGHRFGTTPAQSTATTGGFYGIFFVLLGVIVGISFLMILVTIVAAIVGGVALEGTEGSPEELGLGIVGVIWVGYFFMYVIAFGIYQAMRYKLVYSNIVLGDTRSQSDVGVVGWVKIVLLNSVLLVLTLGIYYPWARVKLTDYMINHTMIESPDLSAFVARTGAEETALGEEFGEAFDLGIGV